MTDKSNKTRATTDGDIPNDILDVAALAAKLGISISSLRARRARDPNSLPPPFLRRPLRWRRATVARWMDQAEHAEGARAEDLTNRQMVTHRSGTK